MENKNTSVQEAGPVNGKSSVMDLAVMGMFIAIIILMAYTPIGLIDLPVIKATILHVPVIIGAILLGPKKGAALGFVFGLTSIIKNTMSPSLLSFVFTPLVPVPGLGRGSLWALAICFVPRILVGVIPYYISAILLFFVKGFSGKKAEVKPAETETADGEGPADEKKAAEEAKAREREAAKERERKTAPVRTIIYAICGAAGSLTNSVGVMGLVYVFFIDAFAAVNNVAVSDVGKVIMGIVATNGLPETIAAAIIVPVVCIAVEKAGFHRI